MPTKFLECRVMHSAPLFFVLFGDSSLPLRMTEFVALTSFRGLALIDSSLLCGS
ncbi:MAG: hypothetical protein SPL73_03545 [Cyanobacteriota bacterium]|nr:hypothetical protein [Cyanobacteriota bacterium]MDY6358322.1 hypothetical protein [Cyanobacteriota bacterium]MDY6363945.1 hypothetical protein [Cyanobacteriota bacterium]MDY6382812.1 hypothetical protein [Cyanobacteriota bacterium]